MQIKAFDSDKEINVEELQDCQGFLIPGGFGSRGWEGKIVIAKYCREHKIPYFGICLGMQVMAVEFARNVCGLGDANSAEFDKITTNNVIDMMEEQKTIKNKCCNPQTHSSLPNRTKTPQQSLITDQKGFRTSLKPLRLADSKLPKAVSYITAQNRSGKNPTQTSIRSRARLMASHAIPMTAPSVR